MNFHVMLVIHNLVQEFDNGKMLDFEGNNTELNTLRKY